MAEIVKHNGDINETLNDKNATKGFGGAFSIEQLKRAVNEEIGGGDTPDTYQLKR